MPPRCSTPSATMTPPCFWTLQPTTHPTHQPRLTAASTPAAMAARRRNSGHPCPGGFRRSRPCSGDRASGDRPPPNRYPSPGNGATSMSRRRALLMGRRARRTTTDWSVRLPRRNASVECCPSPAGLLDHTLEGERLSGCSCAPGAHRCIAMWARPSRATLSSAGSDGPLSMSGVA